MEVIKKYALRLSGWLKAPAFMFMMYAGFAGEGANMFRVAAGAFLLASVLVLALFGKKKEQTELTDEQKEKAAAIEAKGFMGEIEKVLNPKDYTVESSGGISMIGTALNFISGNINDSLPEMTMASSAFIGSVFLWISRDKKNEPSTAEDKTDAPLRFAKSESKMLGTSGGLGKFFSEEIAGKPVRTASALFTIASVMQLVIGITAPNPGMLITGCLTLTSNLISLIFVRKSDYNIEKDEKEKPETTIQHAAHEKTVETRDIARGAA